jgi:uncharacterized membrane protein YhaH (DUF805 family)
MDFMTSVKTCLTKYAIFTGRASRSEHWYFVLFIFLSGLGAAIIDNSIFVRDPQLKEIEPVGALLNLAVLLPSIAVGARRLHDINRSGWWLLLAFTGIGILVLILFACMKGDDGDNLYGPNPLYDDGQN